MKRLGWILVSISLLLGLLPLQTQAANLEVEAKSALLMDVATGTILFEQNSHEALAPASVTKVLTMLLIMEAIDNGKIGWGDSVTTSEAAAAKGGSQVFLKVGESMTVEDMIKSIAVSSANDCACAMAEHLAGSEDAFAEAMNTRAKELGMNDTNFVNCTGLDDGEDAVNHKTSAHDIALMSRELLKNHPDITKFTTIWMDSIRNGEFGLSNTNKMVRFYHGCTGLKTGFTRGAGYCLSASAEREGLQLIAVVMGCETSQKRFAACKSMLDYGFANFALVQPELPEASSIPVKLGVENTVKAIPADDGQMLIDKAQKNLVTTEIQLDEEVTAPVSQGQRLGTMTVKAGEQILSEIPMVAESGVEKITFWQMYKRLLRKAFMK